jgi:hypothetical protein
MDEAISDEEKVEDEDEDMGKKLDHRFIAVGVVLAMKIGPPNLQRSIDS